MRGGNDNIAQLISFFTPAFLPVAGRRRGKLLPMYCQCLSFEKFTGEEKLD